jgi:hypothetical protein
MKKAVLAVSIAVAGSLTVAAISTLNASAAESGLTPGTGAITSGLAGKCLSVDHDKGAGKWSNIHFVDVRTEKIYNNGTGGQFRTAPVLVWTAKYEGTDVGPISNVEITRASFENLSGFHSYIQGQDGNSEVSNVTFKDLKVNGKTITKATDALINVGANTSGITFTTS